MTAVSIAGLSLCYCLSLWLIVKSWLMKSEPKKEVVSLPEEITEPEEFTEHLDGDVLMALSKAHEPTKKERKETEEQHSKNIEKYARRILLMCREESLEGKYCLAITTSEYRMFCIFSQHLLREKYGLTVEENGTSFIVSWDHWLNIKIR